MPANELEQVARCAEMCARTATAESMNRSAFCAIVCLSPVPATSTRACRRSAAEMCTRCWSSSTR